MDLLAATKVGITADPLGVTKADATVGITVDLPAVTAAGTAADITEATTADTHIRIGAAVEVPIHSGSRMCTRHLLPITTRTRRPRIIIPRRRWFTVRRRPRSKAPNQPRLAIKDNRWDWPMWSRLPRTTSVMT